MESVTYRRKRAVPEEGVAMAVVVQKDGERTNGGCDVYSQPADRRSLSGDGSKARGGSAPRVVGGEVTPDRWVLGKITGDISVREISEKLIQHTPLPGGGTEHVAVAEELRRAPLLERRGTAGAAGDCPKDRASLRPSTGYRVGR